MLPPDKTVLVLGAGINGVAIARELLLNRVPVCLVDRADIASGTTAYSSRLIHGGLRYLEYGEFRLVRESLDERERLLRLAPHLVRPLHLFIPVQERTSGIYSAARKFLGRPADRPGRYVPRGLWLVRLGLRLYDWCARQSALPRHQVHPVREPLVPPVDRRRFRWLASYYDAQIQFPERFVLAMLEDVRRLSVEQGVPLHVFTYHDVHKRGAAVTLQPVAGGLCCPSTLSTGDTEMSLHPAAIVNATGAWVDRTLADLQVGSPPLIGGTKGSHFFTRHAQLHAALAGRGVYAEAGDGRPVFLLPFGPYSLVGTTDLPFDGDPASATAGHEELQYLLQAVRDLFPQITLTSRDVDMHYCGVRPLPRTSSAQTAAITRRHLLQAHDDPDIPVVSIIGGKLTTCRSLAEEAAKWVLHRIGVPECGNSRDRVLPGGEGFSGTAEDIAGGSLQLAERLHCAPAQVTAVWQLCGTRAALMLAPPSAGEPAGDGWQSLADTDLPLRFVRRVLRDEWCCRLEDLVERRLMLLYQPGLSRRCLQQLAELMVEQGLLARDSVDAAVSSCIERLKSHFGKAV